MKYFTAIILLVFAVTNITAQEKPKTDTVTRVQQQTPSGTHSPITRSIKSGFYLKLGGAFPMGEFKNKHSYLYPYQGRIDTVNFNGSKFGGVFELGFLIYIGPSFANEHMRAGIDATFLAFSFNPTDQVLPPNTSASKKLEYWYYFGGQKFGPLITINPVDFLMIDLSYKVNATAAWYNSMFGVNLATNEVSLGIRYRVAMFAFQYNWGKVKFTYNHDDNPQYWVDNSTFRVLIGFKF
jgi:hypothetical protein